ncbi:hypothetical protein BCR44DRAFT_1288651 [Catenaria anguillulae PL171]|uniref:Uncharacterized protein n=1 Tax=Catenaria anguillulae PL171 TaxID=765915 RepID=A0A1Y2HB21_9FUNG|nr:hypothetical protein BCR44DRAFT_1288651 [Catenaria anguillulae PL171]
MGSIFRNLFRKKSKSGKSNTPGPHTPPIPKPNHPRPPPSSSASSSTAPPPSALKKPHAPLAPVPEDGTIPIAAEPIPDPSHDDDNVDSAKASNLSTSPYTMASAAASLRSIASVATLRPDPRAQLSSDDEFMSSDSDSDSDNEHARRHREKRKRKKEKKASGKKSKSKKRGDTSTKDADHPAKVKKAGSSASGSTASVSVAGSGSTRGSSTHHHHPQRSRQGSVASSTHPHAAGHTHTHPHRPPTPPLGSAYDGPSSSSDDDDNDAPVALDPVLLARARLGSASSTHLPFAHHIPPSRSASPAPGLVSAGGAHGYQGYPSPGLTNSSAAGSRRGSPAGLIGIVPTPLSPMHPNFHAHHATVAAQQQHLGMSSASGSLSSPLAPGMMRPTAGGANLAYASLSGLRTSPSMTSLHSAYTSGTGFPSRSGSPMVSSSPYHPGTSHHPMLRASPSMTSLHSAYTAGGSSALAGARPTPAVAQLGPNSRFAFPPSASAGNTPSMAASDLTFRGHSDSDEDEIIGLRAMRAGRGGYFLNGAPSSLPGSPARSRAGSNASSVLTAGMANMSLAQPGMPVAVAADDGGETKRDKKDKKGAKKKKAVAGVEKAGSVKSGTKTKPAAPAAPGKDTFYGASPHLPQGTMSAFGPGTFVPFPSPASTSASSDQSSTGSSGKYRHAGGGGHGADPRVAIGVVSARGY